MTQGKIEFYQIRDFGAKINSTVEYIRYNFLPLLKIILLITVPVGLIFSILFSDLFTTMFGMSMEASQGGPPSFEMMGALGTNYLLMIVLSWITTAFLTGTIYTYMRLEENAEVKPQIGEVYQQVLPKVPGLMLLTLVIGLICMVGFLFFILPGIYLMIVLSLAVPIYLFEGVSIGDAISRCFKLIKEKWWSTLGLLFITYLIASACGYVFAIPWYLAVFASVFTDMQENPDPETIQNIFTGIGSTASMAFLMVGSYLTYMIPLIAMAFQYFNLKERQEGTGLKSQIADFENIR